MLVVSSLVWLDWLLIDLSQGNYVFDYFIIRSVAKLALSGHCSDPIFRDRDNNYQAFHNVCRHRAFPVVSKPSGSSLVVGCKVWLKLHVTIS